MLELNKIYNMDCLEGMKMLDDKSVDLIIADPPYYRIMLRDYAGNKYEWDNQWDSFEKYIEWCKLLFIQFKRIIKDN